MKSILLIETSSEFCSVALSNGSELLVQSKSNEAFKHAEHLFSQIDSLCQSSQITYSEIGAVAVSAGPGSYTGLRIGLSAAKGLCLAWDVPLIMISTLKIMAGAFFRKYPQHQGVCIPMVDARRMEVYYGVYNVALKALSKEAALELASDSLRVWADQNPVFIGNGAEKFKALWDSGLGRFDLEVDWDAADMSALAHEAYLNGNFADLAYSEPEYLKPFFTTAKPIE
jgi:tRNA threonylcarbamoyladenosine biosynthesis protein TsaB